MPDIGHTFSYKIITGEIGRGDTGKTISRICRTLLAFVSLSAVASASVVSASEETQSVERQEDPQENFKISVDVNLVTADVTVIGNRVSQLRAEDFAIYDNGVSQKVDYFSHDLLPLAVAVLVDRSGSVVPYFPMLKLAALISLRHLRPEDQVALFSFDTATKKLCDLTEDRLLIAKKINTLKSGGGTNIYAAIRDIVRYLRKNTPNRRRAIILVSDNCQEPQWGNNPKKARTEMLEASTTLYSIRTPGMNFPGCSESHARIKNLADDTGGELLDVDVSTSLQAALKRAISNLRFQYTLGFHPSYPGESGSFHKLTVKLAAGDRCPGCRLLARRGYYFEMAATAQPPIEVQLTRPDSTTKTDQALIQQIILTAGTTELDLPDIPFAVETAERTDADGPPQIQLDFQIDPAKIGFKTVKDRRFCHLDITIFHADKKGRIVDIDWKRLEGRGSEEGYNQITEKGISFSIALPLRAQTRMLRVVIFDEEGNNIGAKLVRLR